MGMYGMNWIKMKEPFIFERLFFYDETDYSKLPMHLTHPGSKTV